MNQVWKKIAEDCIPNFKKPFITRFFYDGNMYNVWVIHSLKLVENLCSYEDMDLESFIKGHKDIDWCYVPD